MNQIPIIKFLRKVRFTSTDHDRVDFDRWQWGVGYEGDPYVGGVKIFYTLSILGIINGVLPIFGWKFVVFNATTHPNGEYTYEDATLGFYRNVRS